MARIPKYKESGPACLRHASLNAVARWHGLPGEITVRAKGWTEPGRWSVLPGRPWFMVVTGSSPEPGKVARERL